ALQAINPARADFAAEAAMLGGAVPVDPIMGIIAAAVVTDPAVVVGVDVRSFRVCGLIAKAAARFGSALPELRRRLSTRCCAAHRRRAMCRNVSASDVRSAMWCSLLVLAMFLAMFLTALRQD